MLTIINADQIIWISIRIDPVPYTKEQREEMLQKFLRTTKMFSVDFPKALESKNKAKVFESMVEHLTVQTVYAQHVQRAGNPGYMADIKLEKMKRQLFRFFGGFPK